MDYEYRIKYDDISFESFRNAYQDARSKNINSSDFVWLVPTLWENRIIDLSYLGKMDFRRFKDFVGSSLYAIPVRYGLQDDDFILAIEDKSQE